MTLTSKLRNGAVVLAKLYKGEPEPLRYTQRTQAEAAAAKVGGVVKRFQGRPFYVVLEDRYHCAECGYHAHCHTERGHGEVHSCQCSSCREFDQENE